MATSATNDVQLKEEVSSYSRVIVTYIFQFAEIREKKRCRRICQVGVMDRSRASLRSRRPPKGTPASKPPRGLKKKSPLLNAKHLAWTQLGFGAWFAVIIALAGSVPALQPFIEPFYRVQYVINDSMAGKGPWDAALVLSFLLGLIGLRAVVLLLALSSAASRFSTAHQAVRFAEQLWSVVYYGGNCIIGLSLLHNSASEYNWCPETLWRGFPHYFMWPATKGYYLAALSFWTSQIYVINIEERRSDHWQMFTHHIVTCLLVLGSYMYSYTRIGHLVLIMMDGVDTVLSLGKVMKYLNFPQRFCDFFFLLFLVLWIWSRHIVYMYQIWFGFFKADIVEGTCSYHPVTKEPVACFSRGAHFVFALLAVALQIITIMWLIMIFKVVIRVIRGEGADDTRSDDES